VDTNFYGVVVVARHLRGCFEKQNGIFCHPVLDWNMHGRFYSVSASSDEMIGQWLIWGRDMVLYLSYFYVRF
jgi:hypothetical protein